jgi:hypothetical protein
MAVRQYDAAYEFALEQALIIIEYEETDVTEEQIRSWQKDDLIDWVNLWSDDDV